MQKAIGALNNAHACKYAIPIFTHAELSAKHVPHCAPVLINVTRLARALAVSRSNLFATTLGVITLARPSAIAMNNRIIPGGALAPPLLANRLKSTIPNAQLATPRHSRRLSVSPR